MYSVEYNQNCILYVLIYIYFFFSTLLSLIVCIYMHEEE